MPTQPRLLAYVAEAALGECAIWRWASYGSKRAYDEATLPCSRYKAIAIQPTSSQNAFHVRSWIATLVSLACTVPTAEPQQRHTRNCTRNNNNCPAGQTNFWSLICTTEHLGRPHLHWFTVSAQLQFTLTTCLPMSCPSFRGVPSCDHSQTNQDVQKETLSGEVIKLSAIMDDVSITTLTPDHSTTRRQLLTLWTIRPPTIDILDHSSTTDTLDH